MERTPVRRGGVATRGQPTVEAFLDCVGLHGGFARFRCPSCRTEHLVAFSGQTRYFCSSGQTKRSVLLAEKLKEQILKPVAHHHYVFTIPKTLRALFWRERSLLSLLSQTAYESIRKSFQQLFQRKDVRPGAVSSIQTFGSFAANFHPHILSLVTEGVFTPEREFLPPPVPATSLLGDIEERFRRLLLQRLNRPERLPDTSLLKLLGWNPAGFSVYANQLVFDDEPHRLERLARYLTRAPLGVERVCISDEGGVELTTPAQPGTRETVSRVDPLDWVHAICQQIPDRSQHLTRYYRAYASRTRRATFPHHTSENLPSRSEPVQEPRDSASSHSPASRASWARLLRKIFTVDPLKCTPCGTEMKLIAVITELHLIDRIPSLLEAGTSPARPTPSPLSVQPSVPAL